MKLVVEGWRSLSQSYAVVNQWHLLALARLPGIDLRIRDLPFFLPTWRQQSGLFPADSESVIRGIEQAEADFIPDATWRVAFPLDLSSAATGPTLVFGTTESQVLRRSCLAEGCDLERARDDPRLTISTPSQWSAQGFRRAGFRDSQIVVIPHGVDAHLFHPRPEQRDELRRRLGLSGFVFMHAGAMTPNKGIDLLLQAFATLAAQRDDVRLLLKGSNRLYGSEQFVETAMASLPPSMVGLVAERLVYCGEELSMEQMALLYQVADAYVSPYRAEGFNLPVLEAAASGVPVICTAGGSTDDFVTDDFALKIDSRLQAVSVEGQPGYDLEPNLDHLIDLMRRIVDDTDFRSLAALSGPAHAVQHFTWDRAVEKTLPLLFPERS